MLDIIPYLFEKVKRANRKREHEKSFYPVFPSVSLLSGKETILKEKREKGGFDYSKNFRKTV